MLPQFSKPMLHWGLEAGDSDGAEGKRGREGGVGVRTLLGVLGGVIGKKGEEVELRCRLSGHIHPSVKSVGIPPFFAHCLQNDLGIQT